MRDNKTEIISTRGDLVQGIDYDDRKLKEQKGHCEVTQRLIIARKKCFSPIQGCRTKGKKTCYKNPGVTRSTCGWNLRGGGVWLLLRALRGHPGLGLGYLNILDAYLSRDNYRTSGTTHQRHSNPFQRRQIKSHY